MKTLLLVAGVARSGSTATDFILGNREDSFSLGEVYAWFRPYRSHHLQPRCACGEPVSVCAVWRQIGRPPARHVHSAVADALDVDIVIDSSKSLSWIWDAHRWGERDGMRVEIVLPWRGLKPVAHSYWKRDVPGWAENLAGYVQRLDQTGLPWRPLIFEDLITDPAGCLEPLYTELGKRYEAGQEQFWKGEFHSLFGSGGTRAQLGDDRSALAESSFDDAFDEYWAELDDGLMVRMAEIDRQIRTGKSMVTGRRMPPPWYFKHRAINVRDRACLRCRPGVDIR